MGMNDRQIRRFTQRLQRTMDTFPRMAAGESVRFFARRFDRGGFFDRGFHKWKPRKNNKDKGRAILVKSGRLRDDIRILSVSRRGFTVGTDLPYARAHNKGGVQYVCPHTRTSRKGKRYQVQQYSYRMPRRTFIAPSHALNRHLKRTLIHLVKQSFKK